MKGGEELGVEQPKQREEGGGLTSRFALTRCEEGRFTVQAEMKTGASCFFLGAKNKARVCFSALLVFLPRSNSLCAGVWMAELLSFGGAGAG